MKECKAQATPMITRQVKKREIEYLEENNLDEQNLDEKIPFREAIGSLLYLAGTCGYVDISLL